MLSSVSKKYEELLQDHNLSSILSTLLYLSTWYYLSFYILRQKFDSYAYTFGRRNCKWLIVQNTEYMRDNKKRRWNYEEKEGYKGSYIKIWKIAPLKSWNRYKKKVCTQMRELSARKLEKTEGEYWKKCPDIIVHYTIEQCVLL